MYNILKYLSFMFVNKRVFEMKKNAQKWRDDQEHSATEGGIIYVQTLELLSINH